MADRRNPPEPGTPEYRWLYGDPSDTGATAAGSGRKQQVPMSDETRVMPVPPPQLPPQRPSRGTGPDLPPGAPPQRPVAPPASRPGRPPRRRGRLRLVKWLVLLWVVFLVVTPVIAMKRVATVDAFPTTERPADQPGTTYLVVGSDSRAGLTKEQRRKLGTGGDVGQRTDTIMLLHVGSGPNLLMSIPRDSLVAIPGHGTTKINAAYAYGGAPLLVRTIENNTGIRIDHFVEIGFGGFVDLVDAVGGITICPTQRMDDKLAKLHVKKGCQEADGATALGYARSRHTSGLGDIDRAKHQREVVSAIGHEAVSPWSVINPVRYWRLNMAGASTVSVSKGTGPWALGRFAWGMTRVDGTKGLTCGVPISDLAVHWDSERSKRMFRLIAQDRTSEIPKGLCTPSGLPKSVTG